MRQIQSNLGIKFVYHSMIFYNTDMKKTLLFTFLLGAALFTRAQGDYHDLLELIVDEKYERCLLKSMKYIESEKTSKEPLPYLYASMAYFRISQGDNETAKTKYPKAFKESIKYLVKHRKKDKEDEFVAEFAEYMSEVRAAIMESAELEIGNEKYTRSKGLYKYMTDIDSEDPGAWIMKGYSEHMMRSKKDASLSWEEAKRIIAERDFESLQDEQKVLLKRAIILTAETLDETGDRESAKEWLELGSPMFGEDKEFGVTYRMIVG